MNPAEHHTRLSPAEMLAELWTRVHENCEAPWHCVLCERPVCMRCEPSPGEPELCPECWWLTDDRSDDEMEESDGPEASHGAA